MKKYKNIKGNRINVERKLVEIDGIFEVERVTNEIGSLVINKYIEEVK